jgi:hypothetical protein
MVMMATLVMTLCHPNSVLARRLTFPEYSYKGILIDGESREFSHRFEEFALDLSILDPYFLQIDIISPLTVTMLALKVTELVICSI